jgi:diaminopimelate decarboxylase
VSVPDGLASSAGGSTGGSAGGQYAKAQRLATRLCGGASPSADEFHVGGIPVSRIAEQVGTPFFVYAGDALVERLRHVRATLGEETELCFSIKANPSLGVCQLIAREGIGAELASIGELLLAQRAGFSARKSVFAGPGKTDQELQAALRWGIESVNVESTGELARLARLAESSKTVARVSLRINPKEQVKGAAMRMGGGHTQFGIDEEMVFDAIDRFKSCEHVKIVGIHVYIGSQIFDVPALLTHCAHVVELAASVAERAGVPLDTIDFGGGFAVPYFESSQDFDLEAFARGFRPLVLAARSRPGLENARPIIELGRFLVGECGVYVTRVVDLKPSRGVNYAVTDGGMNHHITATGNFGQVFRKPYPVAILNRMRATCEASFAIVGPCCTPLDVLGQKIELPPIAVGDLIGIFYSGAYGYSASSLSFLSHPTPAEVLTLGGRVHVLREGGSADQVLRGQAPLP